MSEHEHELPPDPDLDYLPDAIAEAEGSLTLTGVDEDGNVISGPVEKIDLARGFADARRVVDLINREGEPSTFAKTRYRYLAIAEHTYWVSRSFYDRGALIVNRRLADHDQGDGLTFAEDWDEGLT